MSFLKRLFGGDRPAQSSLAPQPSSPARPGGFGRRTSPPGAQQSHSAPPPPAGQPYVTALAAKTIGHFYKTEPPQGYTMAVAAAPFAEELLRELHPAEVLCDLAASLHGFVVPPLFRETERRRVAEGYTAVLNLALHKLGSGTGEWPVSAAQLGAVIDNYRRIARTQRLDSGWTNHFLWMVVVRAAREPQLRGSIIALLDDIARSERNRYANMLQSVAKTMADAGIARDEVPAMRAWDQQAAQVMAARADLLQRAGTHLGLALEHFLDGEHGLYGGRGNFPAPIQNLLSASKAERGRALAFLLGTVVTPRGYDCLQPLARYNGHWAHEYSDSQRPIPRLDLLCFELAKGAVELPDPDGDHARLVFLLGRDGQHQKETSRQILRELLKTISAFPAGRTAAALRDLANQLDYAGWSADIEAAIRDAAPAQSANPDQARPGKIASNLPPLELPDFALGSFADLEKFERHFGNIFEPRLYADPHDRLLRTLAEISVAGEAIPIGPGRNHSVLEMIERTGYRHQYFGDRDPFQGTYFGQFLDRARVLHEKRQALRPFMATDPEVLRQLASLASQIEKKSEPPAKWIEAARPVFAALPPAVWLEQLQRLADAGSFYAGFYGPTGEQFMRVLIYLAHFLPPDQAGPVLTDYALKQCYVTMKGRGIRCERLGNACVWALSAMTDGAGVPYLARILARTKYPKIRAKIDVQLNAAAERSGMGRAELDEITVPTHGLDRDGTYRIEMESGHVLFECHGASATARWFGPGGAELKAPSTAMKAEKELLKEIKSDLAELQADLSIQPQRLQQLYLKDRAWDAEAWRARYFEHPLMRGFARKLVWWFEQPAGARTAALADPAGEQLLDVRGAPVALDGATIRLWHPMDETVEAVEAWRDRLEALQLTQPFAQVWREVYALTDAERATGTYTNRWAAHILKQHQAMTLARINGWRTTHRMWVDAPNNQPWHILLPEHRLVAEYWVEGTGGENPQASDSGAYLYVSTDRVAFFRIPEGAKDSAYGPGKGEAVALETVPPVVFSEIMRHADLFTAVASIAADPAWLDRGENAAHPNQWDRYAIEYWRSTNTAELAESGKRRHAMLARIVPRLKISDRLKLEDRCLVVRGTRHTYEIHLGSGACARAGRHICIVPKSSEPKTADRIWLPFEGDRTLSIIISKAMLLAADDKITDPVILRQL